MAKIRIIRECGKNSPSPVSKSRGDSSFIRSSGKHIGNPFLMSGKIADKKIPILVDTGADVSLIN